MFLNLILQLFEDSHHLSIETARAFIWWVQATKCYNLLRNYLFQDEEKQVRNPYECFLVQSYNYLEIVITMYMGVPRTIAYTFF